MLQSIEEMLQRVGRQHGLEIEVDGDGDITILYDDIHECLVSITDDGNRLMFRTPLCSVDSADQDSVFERALILNLHGAGTGGGKISLSQQAPVLCLDFEQPAQQLGETELAQRLGQFIAVSRRIRSELAKSAPAVETGA